MSKRVTIMIDEKNDTKLRKMQAMQIQKENKSISYSAVINGVLAKALK